MVEFAAHGRQLLAKDVLVSIDDTLKNTVRESLDFRQETSFPELSPTEQFYVNVFEAYEQQQAKTSEEGESSKKEDEEEVSKDDERPLQSAEEHVAAAHQELSSLLHLLELLKSKEHIDLTQTQSSKVPECSSVEQMVSLIGAKQKHISEASGILSAGGASLRKAVEHSRNFSKDLQKLSEIWRISITRDKGTGQERVLVDLGLGEGSRRLVTELRRGLRGHCTVDVSSKAMRDGRKLRGSSTSSRMSDTESGAESDTSVESRQSQKEGKEESKKEEELNFGWAECARRLHRAQLSALYHALFRRLHLDSLNVPETVRARISDRTIHVKSACLETVSFEFQMKPRWSGLNIRSIDPDSSREVELFGLSEILRGNRSECGGSKKRSQTLPDPKIDRSSSSQNLLLTMTIAVHHKTLSRSISEMFHKISDRREGLRVQKLQTEQRNRVGWDVCWRDRLLACVTLRDASISVVTHCSMINDDGYFDQMLEMQSVTQIEEYMRLVVRRIEQNIKTEI